MKKYLNLSLIYAIAAMAGGVFYREFTKLNGYSGATALGKVHVHLFMLGTMVYLITALMMVIRGITQVLNISMSAAANASISGIAGIGHILTGAGLILLLISLKKIKEN